MEQSPAEMYVWQVIDEDGRWGSIAAALPLNDGPPTMMQLVSRSRLVATQLMAPVARQHAAASGMEVRLARYVLAEVVENFRDDGRAARHHHPGATPRREPHQVRPVAPGAHVMTARPGRTRWDRKAHNPGQGAR